ncbi:MAG: HAD family hydrolase [Alphaproteobacteria bacterium]
MADLKLVAFDYDGTISDSLALIIDGFSSVFEKHGLPLPTEAQICGVIGLTLETCFEVLAPGQDINQLADDYRNHHNAMRNTDLQERLYDNASQVLSELDRAGYLLSVCTGKNLRGLNNGLSLHGLSSRFLSLHTPDTAPSKPAPDMLYHAMDRAGVEANQTVMIGDSVHDMRMAVAAGTKAIGVAWGYCSVADLRATGADVIVESWLELPAAIKGLIG